MTFASPCCTILEPPSPHSPLQLASSEWSECSANTWTHGPKLHSDALFSSWDRFRPQVTNAEFEDIQTYILTRQ